MFLATLWKRRMNWYSWTFQNSSTITRNNPEHSRDIVLNPSDTGHIILFIWPVFVNKDIKNTGERIFMKLPGHGYKGPFARLFYAWLNCSQLYAQRRLAPPECCIKHSVVKHSKKYAKTFWCFNIRIFEHLVRLCIWVAVATTSWIELDLIKWILKGVHVWLFTLW